MIFQKSPDNYIDTEGRLRTSCYALLYLLYSIFGILCILQILKIKYRIKSMLQQTININKANIKTFNTSNIGFSNANCSNFLLNM